jgi:hypothetical protein
LAAEHIQSEDPIVELLPIGHVKQDVAVPITEYLFAGQNLQNSPAGAYEPGPHSVQESDSLQPD